MELKLKISDVDYDSIAELLLPFVSEQMDKGGGELWSKLLFVSQGGTNSAASKILSRMSQEKKDEMLIKYINRNKQKLAEMLMELAADKNIQLTVSDVEAKKD